jgi:hypothetical protein
MAASLRSTRAVAKAVLPNRMGRTDYRLSGRILAANTSPGILFVTRERRRSGHIAPRSPVLRGCRQHRIREDLLIG